MSRRFLDRVFSQAEFREGQRQARHYKKPQRRQKAEQETELEPDVVDRIVKAAERKDFLK